MEAGTSAEDIDMGELVMPKQFGDESGASTSKQATQPALSPWYVFPQPVKGTKRAAKSPPECTDQHHSSGKCPARHSDPLPLTPAEHAKCSVDKADVAATARTLEAMRDYVMQREEENNEAYHKNKYPEWRLLPLAETADPSLQQQPPPPPPQEAAPARAMARRIVRDEDSDDDDDEEESFAIDGDSDDYSIRDLRIAVPPDSEVAHAPPAQPEPGPELELELEPQRYLAHGKDLPLTRLLSCDTDEELKKHGAVLVSYEDFTRASNSKVDVSLLGCADDHVRIYQKIAHSNRESVTFNYAMNNLKELIESVPSCNGDHRLTGVQRLSNALVATAYDEGQHIMVKDKGATKNIACYRLHANENTEVIVNNLPVAAGKTRATIFSTMSRLATTRAWDATHASCTKFREEGINVQYLGLSKVPFIDPEPSKVARVVIALVPVPVMKQWVEASEKLSKAFGDNGWLTWFGLSAKFAPPGTKSTMRTLATAVAATDEKGCALFWVLEACTKSSTAALMSMPNYTVPYRIIDEGTGSHLIEPRTRQQQSTCRYTIICNATLDQLEKHTSQQPKHPLRRAMGGQNMNLCNTQHCAIATMCSLPSWLRLAVGMSMAPLMPRGILKICMRVQVKSLAGALNSGSDMLITSIEDLVQGLIMDNCSDMSQSEKAGLSAKCHAILEGADPSASIAANLTKAIAAVQADDDALPPLPQPAVPGEPLEPADRLVRDDILRHAKVYSTMRRLFNNLKRAVCLDPPPQCPITLDVIAPENVCILSCCTTFIDKTVVSQLVSQRCPMCRQQITGLASAAQAVSTILPAAPEPKPATELLGPPPVLRGDTDSLVVAFKAAAGSKCKSSLAAVVQCCEIALQFKPKGLRVLLCCNTHGNSRTYNATLDETKNTAKSCAFLKSALPLLTSVSTIGRGVSSQMPAYKKTDKTNRVLLIDTSARSTTMAGLDLQMTDVIIFDRLGNHGDIELSKIVQSIGRAMRAQKKGADEAKADARHYKKHGFSRHAPKIVIFLDKYKGA